MLSAKRRPAWASPSGHSGHVVSFFVAAAAAADADADAIAMAAFYFEPAAARIVFLPLP